MIAIAFSFISGLLQTEETAAAPALGGYDPVELVRGREVPGDPAWTLEHYLYRYQFATEANRDTFLAEPQQYEIQLAGGCARMGPLSGKGDPDRYVVHDGRIYVFASDSCRDSFTAAPADHLDGPDAVPAGSASQHERGQQLLQQALSALGGAEQVDALLSYQAVRSRQQASNEAMATVTDTWSIVFPNWVRHESTWGDWRQVEVVTPGRSFIHSGPDHWAMHEVERSAVFQQFLREPLFLLHQRHRPGFIAMAEGPWPNHPEVQQVAVHIAGVTTHLGVEEASGRIEMLRYRGRPGAGPNGEVVVRFADWRPLGPLTLPFARQLRFRGEPLASQSFTWSRIELDLPFMPGDFAP